MSDILCYSYYYKRERERGRERERERLELRILRMYIKKNSLLKFVVIF